MMIQTLIAQHHQLMREGIARLLQGERDIAACGEAVHADALVRGLKHAPADVVLLDLHLPPAGGLEALRRALRTCPAVRIICIGLNRHGPYPARLLEHGAAGVLTLGCSRNELLTAVRSVARGEVYVGAELAQDLLRAGFNGTREPVAELSARELSVLKLLSEGRRLQEISDRLCISAKTVSTYRSRVCRKLGVSSDVELTHLSLEHGLIENRYCF